MARLRCERRARDCVGGMSSNEDGTTSQAMPTDTKTSATFDAKALSGAQSRRHVTVDARFAERLRTEHVYTFEVKAEAGREITRDLPYATEEMLSVLDERGIVAVGTEVRPGTYLVGMREPAAGARPAAEDRLLAAIFGDPEAWVEVPLVAPAGCYGAVRAIEAPDASTVRVTVGRDQPLEIGDVLRLGAEEAVVVGIEALDADIRWGARDGLVVPVTRTALARDAMSARSVGPYGQMLYRPIEGPDALAGQRMERDQAEVLATHAPWLLWESYTLKSDAKPARIRAWEALVQGINPANSAVRGELPETLVVLGRTLAGLGLEVEFGAEALSARPLDADVAQWSHGRIEHGQAFVDSGEPLPGGFACQRIFGPVEDFTCACGALSGYRHFGCTCVECGVDVLRSDVRRKRFGHVELAVPCRHPVLGDEGPPLEILPVLPPSIRFDGIDDSYARVWAAQRSAGALQIAIDELAAALIEAAEWLWRAAFSKPVDYSGVAHLVADPGVEPGSCRLPRSMAMELFRPFACAILQDRGYVTTLRGARRMVDREEYEAVAAIHQACVGRPLLLAAGANMVARKAELWDAAAVAVDPATAELLAARSVVVHVPLSHQSALECTSFPDCPKAAPRQPGPWLGRAARGSSLIDAVRGATLGDDDYGLLGRDLVTAYRQTVDRFALKLEDGYQRERAGGREDLARPRLARLPGGPDVFVWFVWFVDNSYSRAFAAS